MPPAVSVPLGAIVFGVLYLIFGARYAPGLGAGFFAGYLVYDMIHYYLHHFRPRGRLGRMLRERHMRHHFQDDTRGFGISAPYWDEVFRHLLAQRAAPASARNKRACSRASAARARDRRRARDSVLDSTRSARTGRRQTAERKRKPWPPPTSTGS